VRKKKTLVFAFIAAAIVIGAIAIAGCAAPRPRGQADIAPQRTNIPTVYFTRGTDTDALLRAFRALGVDLSGYNVAVNIHGGELNSFALSADFMDVLRSYVGGTFVETNTAYGGPRDATETHRQVAEALGFTGERAITIMDATGQIEIPVNTGRRLQYNLVGDSFWDFDFYINLSHFTGHITSGFGGALKNMSLGLSSADAKRLIHSGGHTRTVAIFDGPLAPFHEAIAEAALSVYHALEGRILHITVLDNLSIFCDCAGAAQPAPDISDIGILASWDAVAIDQAAMDLIWRRNLNYARPTTFMPGRTPPPHSTNPNDANFPAVAVAAGARLDGEGISLLQMAEALNSQWILDYAQRIGLGSTAYILVNID